MRPTLSEDHHLELLSHRHDMLEATLRKRSSTMLFVGACMSLLGFMIVLCIGLLKANYTIDGIGEHNYCESYNKTVLTPCYFPSTMGEMVHGVQDPSCKVYLFFEFVGALIIFLSYYPTMLRNAYIGDDLEVGLLCTSLSWVTFRQYIPTLGLMMLAVITTVPLKQANVLDSFCIGFHVLGGGMKFIGYFLVESVTVGWGPFFKGLPQVKRTFQMPEERLRKLCLHGLVMSYIIFVALQVFLGIMDHKEGFDFWEIPPGMPETGQKKLVKTANMHVKSLKITSFATEASASMFIILSHLVIWYHCEERDYDLHEEIMHLESQGSMFTAELTRASSWARGASHKAPLIDNIPEEEDSPNPQSPDM